jgi:hypothetical protein
MDGRGLCRYAVLFRLPGLRFLDFQAVKQPERVEAKKRGKFTAVAKPKGAPSDGGATTEVDLSVNLVCVCLLCLTTHLRASQYPLTPLNGTPLAFVCKTVAPCPSISRLAPQFAQVAAAVADHSDGTEPTGEHEARTYLGFNPYNYLGRESEGNRFITNDAL